MTDDPKHPRWMFSVCTGGGILILMLLSRSNPYMLPLPRSHCADCRMCSSTKSVGSVSWLGIDSWPLLFAFLTDRYMSVCLFVVRRHEPLFQTLATCLPSPVYKRVLPILGTFDLAVGKTTSHNNHYNEGEDKRCTARLHCMLITRLCATYRQYINMCSSAVLLPRTRFILQATR